MKAVAYVGQDWNVVVLNNRLRSVVQLANNAIKGKDTVCENQSKANGGRSTQQQEGASFQFFRTWMQPDANPDEEKQYGPKNVFLRIHPNRMSPA